MVLSIISVGKLKPKDICPGSSGPGLFIAHGTASAITIWKDVPGIISPDQCICLCGGFGCRFTSLIFLSIYSLL